MTRLLSLALFLVAATGCFDENKTDCRNDGDCRGVRVCRGGGCVTPEGFQNNGIPPADDRDAGGDAGDDVAVDGTGDVAVTLDGGTAD